MNLKNRLLLIVLLIAVLITSIFFVLKFTGFAINSPSSVSIELPISVNSSLFDGSTTDFSNMNNNQLRNISEMILEKTEYGKIIFQKSIDLTQDSKNGVVDLDKNVNISNNKIEINTDELTSLEKPAVLYLYNLSFNNPRIMRNGIVCPDSVCQKINYSFGTLVFSVTSFTAYGAEETPITPTISLSGVGGGGGAGGVATAANFTVDKDLIKISLKTGETKRETLEIMNMGETALNISIEGKDIGKFFAISKDAFRLEAKKVKTINLDFFAKEEEIPDAYTGRIVVRANGIEKVINVIIEIRAKKPLFDIRTDVLDRDRKPGEKVRANITIVNMGDLEHIDVFLYYALKDFGNKVSIFKEENLAIDKSLSVIRELDIPSDSDYGGWIFYSKISYNDVSAASVGIFEIKKPISAQIKESKWFWYALLAMGLLIFIALIVVIYLIYKKLSAWYFFKREQDRLKTKTR